ncbi:hypothetical protein Aduo_006456 [Ancylostoma duodenale]
MTTYDNNRSVTDENICEQPGTNLEFVSKDTCLPVLYREQKMRSRHQCCEEADDDGGVFQRSHKDTLLEITVAVEFNGTAQSGQTGQLALVLLLLQFEFLLVEYRNVNHISVVLECQRRRRDATRTECGDRSAATENVRGDCVGRFFTASGERRGGRVYIHHASWTTLSQTLFYDVGPLIAPATM